ncbi:MULTISPECIES: UDP-N-acetylmuramoyl-tripeptide--D-alanyl-D-alanine ligase [Gordonia]|uniref:UDP-N-acetylmuramoyl-tripeptide--D-alanyl-D-alanine ligase n=2 Tax=Gordonia terrae TaxID=2055 RepID=A0AAD0NYX3_9ACTN|nr:hypothetical protein [Gordonia terrae]VTR07526.1 Uncharacterised protein [Clostridioides difficile]ANY24006.1 UDP-N-acetylmuramoyl-tripeptide--D-alanyl-D-alanine ligase [Gordonia terrae]AWO84745.1 UDP-N-acetylmuramoyl-tripeptide--D-alanyl-D-alanine ligase [Gordonia terrae]UPW07406.1 UDP-N-acetylmuramoyl-tripeptide--D-alanyl-D-alanine ligase [Gordonia terrae]VTS56429.1 Uncharacterised protein [Gordonia terrae]
MTTPSVTVIRGNPPVSVDDARLLLRRLAESAGAGRTWAVIAELASPAGLTENQRVVEHDLLGRLAVRLAVDKTLCVGDSRSVHALHQGAVMEGSWGDEARIVASADEAAGLADTDPDWRPAAGDVILLATATADLDAVVSAWSEHGGWQVVVAATGEESAP